MGFGRMIVIICGSSCVSLDETIEIAARVNHDWRQGTGGADGRKGKSLIGHPIHIGRYDYKIMGIDSHYPKRSVLLVRTKDNVKARCTPELIARQTNQ